jgi:hypothetical protein
MAGSYTVRTAALTIGAATKWVDNVLSHYKIDGVEQGTRGVERRLNDDALLALALCRIASSELGVPLANAVAIAQSVVADRETSGGTHVVAPSVFLQFSLTEIEGRLRQRLSDATEAVAHIRRGRPALRPR